MNKTKYYLINLKITQKSGIERIYGSSFECKTI